MGRWLFAAVLAILLLRLSGMASTPLSRVSVRESARGIPLAYSVDVVVVGGSTGAVAAAVAAAQSGAHVFLAAPQSYLGEDMTATYRLWLEPGEVAQTPLGREIFASGNPARPMVIKRTLDKALLDAGVQFLYSSYVTDILHDAYGNPAGIVIANRAGRQAVTAKVIIDATDHAWVARQAGAEFTDFPTGKQTFTRVILSEKKPTPKSTPGVTLRRQPFTIDDEMEMERADETKYWKKINYQVTEYTLELPQADASFQALNNAEHLARDMTYNATEASAAEMLFQVPADQIIGMDASTVGVFRPRGMKQLYVLNGCADVSRTAAAKLLRPDAFIAAGEIVGIAAGKEANNLRTPVMPQLASSWGQPIANGDTAEFLIGVRPTQQLPKLPSPARTLPVVGQYDVVVVGGGTSGCPAGISAARAGAKTLVVEYQRGLGGVGTVGLISRYWFGNPVGFASEVPVIAGGTGNWWSANQRMEWWRKTLRTAGADVWTGTLGCGAFVEGGDVRGIIVATPQGRGVVLAKTVIDSTGNADIAAAAGAKCVTTDASDIAWQRTGVAARNVDPQYTNKEETEITIADENDMVDITNLLVSVKMNPDRTFQKAFDLAPLIGTRERRRIVGDYSLTVLDQVNERIFSDSIVWSKSNCDSHSYTIDPFFELPLLPAENLFYSYTPYRCLLPVGLEGILVTGLGVSCHRDALPVIRMQRDLMNQGYAAGLAAVQAINTGVKPRNIDIKILQQRLVSMGALPKDVTFQDSYPLAKAQLEAAIISAPDNYRGVPLLLAQPVDSIPMLQKAYAAGTSDAKQVYAELLAVLGDATGIDTIIATVNKDGWNRGSLPADSKRLKTNMSGLIYALGCMHDKRALPAITAKAALLDEKSSLRAFRAVAIALERIDDPAGADTLARLLTLPGVRNHVVTKVGQLNGGIAELDASVREITLARALYRCGDKDGLGKSILQEYVGDLRGHFSEHGLAVLAEKR